MANGERTLTWRELPAVCDEGTDDDLGVAPEC